MRAPHAWAGQQREDKGDDQTNDGKVKGSF
jgi:hypothetical protein